MYRVCNWLIETALAKKLPEEGMINECVNHVAIPGFAEAVLDDRTQRSINALKRLRLEYRQMDGDTFREVMTVAHFSQYFTDALSRAFYQDYNYQVGAWSNYIYMDEAPDFRDIKRFRMGEPGTLTKRREKAEHKPTNIEERTPVQIAVDEYSRQFDVSWRTLINDDLGKIRETPQRMAKAAARWLDAFVSDLYDNGTTQATLAALGAPWAGTGRLTIPNLAIGINAMKQRTDADGNRIQIDKVWLVIPPILEIQAQQILKDLINFGGPNSNVLSGFIAGYYVDPYIATSGPNVPWYLFGDPKTIPVVTLVRMAGWTGPVVAMKESDLRIITGSAPAAFTMGSFHTGDIEYMVEDIVGAWDDASYVGVTDYRGLYYSSGTTP